tara:strand:+ start:2359 stop:3162 length:804 start_codon:yes stop_codon:yes gene_type:complete
MIEYQIILLGIIQGLTEFLPISSSAHLVIIPEIFNWKDQGIVNDIAVHIGTLGSVLIYFRKDIISILFDIKLSVFQRKSNQDFLYIKIIISTLPAILVGFIVYNYFIEYFRNVELIAYSCIFFAIILYFSDNYSGISSKSWSNISFFDAFIIGIFQCFAFIPGASRAGVVITGSRLIGLSRESSAIYSILLSIPIIFASLILTLPDLFNEELNNYSFIQIIITTLVSFITAILSIKFMIELVKKSSYAIFAFYRIILGIILLIWIYT